MLFMKRVLIVFNSFYGPGMGHNRLLRIIRNLPRFGWEPVVLTEQCRHAPFQDTLPSGSVRQVPSLDLQHIYARMRGKSKTVATSNNAPTPKSRSIGLTTFINRWFLVPDKQVTWIKPARQAARELSEEKPFDLVFASSLPATNVLAGARIAHDLGVPCVMEYRDLWTGNPYHNLTPPTRLHAALHARLERDALGKVSQLTCLSTGISEIVERRLGQTLTKPPHVYYNFFDPEEFASLDHQHHAASAFTISYVGTMYLSRNPAMFFQAMRMFINRNGLSPAQFRFRWLGFIVGIDGLQAMIDENGVAPYIDFLGQIPHREALNELCRSHASLIIQAPEDTIHIPGKMFEAMGARVPLLAIANPCEVTRIIDRTSSGLHAPYETRAVANAMETLWVHYRTGNKWRYAEPEVGKFSVGSAVSEIAGLFDANRIT
jgi:glycosyltransferase involved in cell wall biosynthesis